MIMGRCTECRGGVHPRPFCNPRQKGGDEPRPYGRGIAIIGACCVCATASGKTVLSYSKRVARTTHVLVGQASCLPKNGRQDARPTKTQLLSDTVFGNRHKERRVANDPRTRFLRVLFSAACLVVLLVTGWTAEASPPVWRAPSLGVTGKADSKISAQCPGTARQARIHGRADAVTFRLEHPSGLWSGFVHKFRGKFRRCAPFIKAAYLDAARKLFQIPSQPRFRSPY